MNNNIAYLCHQVYSLAQLYEISGDISQIARQGSGSACRSVYGGFVAWISGVKADGTDSIAKQLVPANHWPEMRVLILVVSILLTCPPTCSSHQQLCMNEHRSKF